MVSVLNPLYIKPETPGTAEYFAKRGTGAFRFFSNAVYALDIVKVNNIYIIYYM